MADFDDAVADVLLGLAEGQVVSYGWVATKAGYPGRARAVGHFLAHHGHGLPWWRVVRADGSLVSPHPDHQVEALRAEGVRVEGRRVALPAEHPPKGGQAPRDR
jgi:methylated-DNA-protein-cysteine methyltransferase-like protein